MHTETYRKSPDPSFPVHDSESNLRWGWLGLACKTTKMDHSTYHWLFYKYCQLDWALHCRDHQLSFCPTGKTKTMNNVAIAVVNKYPRKKIHNSPSNIQTRWYIHVEDDIGFDSVATWNIKGL